MRKRISGIEDLHSSLNLCRVTKSHMRLVGHVTHREIVIATETPQGTNSG